MAHQRNTEGLAIAAKNRRERTINRVNEAISCLLREKQVINFNTVAKAASVGKTWLYKEADIKATILNYRNNNIASKPRATTSPSSLASKDALIKMLQERVKQAEAENHELKKQIEVLYGKLA